VATFRKDESMITIKLASEATISVNHTKGCFTAGALIRIIPMRYAGFRYLAVSLRSKRSVFTILTYAKLTNRARSCLFKVNQAKK